MIALLSRSNGTAITIELGGHGIMRRAQELELGLAPRPAGTTLQRWLYDELRAAILSGRIAAGRRLPSSRDLARQQGVSRGTVLSVYEQLMAEGYLASTTGSGTVVVDALRLQGAPARPVAPALPGGRHLSPPSPPSPLSRLSRQGGRLADSPFPLYESSLTAVPFRPNQPDLAGRFQGPSATEGSRAIPWLAQCSQKTSAGVRKPRDLRGRVLRDQAI